MTTFVAGLQPPTTTAPPTAPTTTTSPGPQPGDGNLPHTGVGLAELLTLLLGLGMLAGGLAFQTVARRRRR